MSVPHAFRTLQRTPAFTTTVILTLVLGIAAVGAMFAIVHGVLLAPLPYGEPEQLVSVDLQGSDQQPMAQPSSVYFTYRQFAQQFSAIGFHRSGSANLWIDGDDAAAERVTATWLTSSMVRTTTGTSGARCLI